MALDLDWFERIAPQDPSLALVWAPCRGVGLAAALRPACRWRSHLASMWGIWPGDGVAALATHLETHRILTAQTISSAEDDTAGEAMLRYWNRCCTSSNDGTLCDDARGRMAVGGMTDHDLLEFPAAP